MDRRKLQPTPREREAMVTAFNAKHAIGSTIQVFPGERAGLIDEVQVAEPGAYVLGGHTPVVQVTGGRRSYGCIALSHVRQPAAPSSVALAANREG